MQGKIRCTNEQNRLHGYHSQTLPIDTQKNAKKLVVMNQKPLRSRWWPRFPSPRAGTHSYKIIFSNQSVQECRCACFLRSMRKFPVGIVLLLFATVSPSCAFPSNFPPVRLFANCLPPAAQVKQTKLRLNAVYVDGDNLRQVVE